MELMAFKNLLGTQEHSWEVQEEGNKDESTDDDDEEVTKNVVVSQWIK